MAPKKLAILPTVLVAGLVAFVLLATVPPPGADITLVMADPGEPPSLSDMDIWAMFALRILFIFGPLGFIAWKFTKIRDPETGAQAAGMMVICFIAIIILWFIADAIEEMLAAV